MLSALLHGTSLRQDCSIASGLSTACGHGPAVLGAKLVTGNKVVMEVLSETASMTEQQADDFARRRRRTDSSCTKSCQLIVVFILLLLESFEARVGRALCAICELVLPGGLSGMQ